MYEKNSSIISPKVFTYKISWIGKCASKFPPNKVSKVFENASLPYTKNNVVSHWSRNIKYLGWVVPISLITLI